MQESQEDAVLLLKDGTIFRGVGFGADRVVEGEVVFNTGMVGYPESLTDPSYYGQILVQTWPLVGNYGVPSSKIADGFGVPLHFESKEIQVRGYVVSELAKVPSHWSSSHHLEDWFAESGLPGIQGIDTRELTKKLRTQGTMLGILAKGRDIDPQALSRRLGSISDPNREDLVRPVSVSKTVDYNLQGTPKVALVDCGVKYGIVRNLLARGARVLQMPYDTPADEILSHSPAGVVISNGPGDPKMCRATIESARGLLETDVPMLGICLGTQILALAGGGDTYKLKFGHRAQNHPCVELKTGRVYLTTQNHGYTVDQASLKDFATSFVNLNDKTVEGISHRRKAVVGVQFHPEASPGPYETGFLFDQFLERARSFQGKTK
ncbi:MAG TPA: glutamine-hydrolyzing carbamoyl-phosphate synthase small subunit [Nitrososphaerales archaeon]|nr:glutamine-hydrolyzing carbamoyl-phosphate synthase small subunit [Nitrososphaerales archaeon]